MFHFTIGELRSLYKNLVGRVIALEREDNIWVVLVVSQTKEGNIEALFIDLAREVDPDMRFFAKISLPDYWNAVVIDPKNAISAYEQQIKEVRIQYTDLKIAI